MRHHLAPQITLSAPETLFVLWPANDRQDKNASQAKAGAVAFSLKQLEFRHKNVPRHPWLRIKITFMEMLAVLFEMARQKE